MIKMRQKNFSVTLSAASIFASCMIFTTVNHLASAQTPASIKEKLPLTKTISLQALSSYKQTTVTIKEGDQDVKYEGVPLRSFLHEFLPDSKLDEMPDRKAIARRKLVMEVTADDNYPGLVTALEVAMNSEGDKFILAAKKDGKALEGVQMICRLDEMHTRWVHNIVKLRLVEIKD